MPNGAHNAQCLNCRFMVNSEYRWSEEIEEDPVWSEDRCWCRLHDFVMPDIDGEVLCSDFDWAGNGPGLQEDERLRAVEPGFLYRYCYATGEPAARIASFQALQNLFFSARIHTDPELGWSIYLPRQQEPTYLPAPEAEVILRLNGQAYRFSLIEAMRTRKEGGHRARSGEWVFDAYTNRERIFYSLAQPDLLYRWLDRYLDVEAELAYKRTHPFGETLLAMGFSVFLEVLQHQSEYALHPDLFAYGRFRRPAEESLS